MFWISKKYYIQFLVQTRANMTATTVLVVLLAAVGFVTICVVGYCCFCTERNPQYNSLEMHELTDEEKAFKAALEADGMINAYHDRSSSDDEYDDDAELEADELKQLQLLEKYHKQLEEGELDDEEAENSSGTEEDNTATTTTTNVNEDKNVDNEEEEENDEDQEF